MSKQLQNTLSTTTGLQGGIKRGLVVALLLTVNVWPALYNRQPFFYSDTTAYIRGADAGFHSLFRRSSGWSQHGFTAYASLSSVRDKAVLSGRSVYYGVLLYLSDLAGRLWPAPFVQSALVLIAVALTLRRLLLFTWRHLTVISLVLAALTPMPFFVSFLTPDIFAAITILAMANLLVGPTRKLSPTTLFWTGLLSAALLFHISHVLMAVTLLVLFLLAALLPGVRICRLGIAAVICSLAVAFAGEFIFDLGVKKLVGEAPLRPPILTARLIADGPGYRFLLATCPASGFEACHFLNRLPLAPDDFVWDSNPSSGVFAASDPATRRALSNEQYRFAWAVFRFSPLAEVAHFIRDSGIQITRIGYEEFNYDPGAHDFFRSHLPLPYYNAMTSTLAWSRRIPASVLSVVAIASTCLALLWLAYFLVVKDVASIRSRGIVVSFALFICLGVLVNGTVCAISATHDRYQMRVIWLIPFAAMLLGLKPNSSASPQSTT